MEQTTASEDDDNKETTSSVTLVPKVRLKTCEIYKEKEFRNKQCHAVFLRPSS